MIFYRNSTLQRQNDDWKHANDEWAQFSSQHRVLEFFVLMLIFKQPFAWSTSQSTCVTLGNLCCSIKKKKKTHPERLSTQGLLSAGDIDREMVAQTPTSSPRV